MEENKKCITFLPFKTSKKAITECNMNECIDATYIIHLENNGRMENILKQLEFFTPSDTIYIVVNKGFRKCEKSLPKQQPPYDLVDTNLHILKHAEENNIQGNILTLEDDFIWSTEMNRLNISSVSKFINSRKEKEITYYLGIIPLLHIPMNFHHNYAIFGVGAHSVIYTKPMRQKILKTDISLMPDWDLFLNFHTTSYYYYIPLCYQLFPETDNQKHWGIHNPIIHFMSFIVIRVFRILELDKKPEPGFAFCYYLSVLFFYVGIFIVFLILFSIIYITGLQSYKIYKLREILDKIKTKILRSIRYR